MPQNKISSIIIIILLVALIVRIVLFLAILQRNPDGFLEVDSYGYLQIAENIVNHGSYSSSSSQPLVPEHSRTPLYPLFISLLEWAKLNVAGIIFIQILLSSVTCFLVISLSYNLTGSWQSSCLAGAIVALDIPSIALSNSLLTETLFTFLLTLSILYLILFFKRDNKIAMLVCSGILMGLSILCRPIGVFLPFFLAILFLIFSQVTKKQLVRNILIYYVSCFFVISPWLVRNQVVFGSPFLSTISSDSLLYYRAAGVYAVKEGISLSKSQEILREKAKSEFDGDAEQEPIKYKRYEAKIATSLILKYPIIYIRNHIISVFNMLFKPLRSTIDLQLGFAEKGTTLTGWGKQNNFPMWEKLLQKTSVFTVILVLIQLFTLIILWISSIYGTCICFLRKEHLIWGTIILVIIYFCIMAGGPEAYARLRVPIVPFLAIGSAIGIVDMYGRLKIHKFRRI